MNKNERIVNKRHLNGHRTYCPLYYNSNGILKKYKQSLFGDRVVSDDSLWIRLKDLPVGMQVRLKDVSITIEELSLATRSTKNFGVYYDNDQVKVIINEDTPLLPIVGNVLPSDGVNAYTVTFDEGKPCLKPILICWSCHWSELFTGNTKYGNNVFCLASDLSPSMLEEFIDDIIPLKETPDYLKGFDPTRDYSK